MQRLTWFDLVADSEVRQNRATSDPLNIVPRPVRNEIRENFFSNRVVTRWNRVPYDIKRLNNVDSFKSNIKALLMNNLL